MTSTTALRPARRQIRSADRVDRPDLLWLGMLALLCVAIGVLTGNSPTLGLLASIGLVFALVVIRSLTLGFLLFTVLSFLDLLSSSGSFSGSKVIGLLLLGSWLARVTTRRHGELRSFVARNGWLTVALIAMLGWSALSFAWASSPGTALTGASRYALDMMLLPIAFAAITRREHVTAVVAAFVVGAAFSALFGIVGAAAAIQGRLTGGSGDPNAEAAVLAAAIPLLLGLAGARRRSARTKLAALGGLAILFLGLVNTVSRGGLVSLGAVMVAGVIFGGAWRRRAAVLLAVGVTATVAYFFVVAPLAARERVTMSDTSGRSSIWSVAERVISAHPLLGVGTDNFILVEGQYINRPGEINAHYIIVVPKVAHDIYLEALVDLGIPGLLTLVAVLALAIAAGVRAAWLFERLGDRELELTSRTVVLGLVAILTSDAFISDQYSKALWILLALCPVLLAIARRATAEGSEGSRRGVRTPPSRL